MKGIQVCSNEGSRVFIRGDTYKIETIHWQHFKNILRSIGAITTKLRNKHLGWRGFTFLFQNHRANYNQTLHKASVDEGNSVLFNYYETAKIHWQNFKLFSSIIWPVKGAHGFTNKDDLILKNGDYGCSFSLSTLLYNHSFAQTCLLIWTGFSGERSGTWSFF